ncbi:DUF3750 domain-containing protein [Azospirillum rugosum]|uniref:DUF3750 domain-containing protein n=1 Tax=Azospirillum rugosum TaxID=416170 RepID=A0ABS4SFW6_9PROT|nr:DUF3750 domain-containing protein [Azospirillum rugosum]MBP2291402.1 hypothetical protein [Azospirillum rugosum]MDQ0525190.1 hypothetical protein [Azospirillum rugosum]
MKVILGFLLLLVLLLTGPAFVIASGSASLGVDWSRADRSPVGLAPDPATTAEAVVQVYAARALSWRGAFGVHPWFAVKPAGARAYTVYEVIGWRVYRGLPAVSVSNRDPDGRWFGSQPSVLAELRGADAEAAIPKIAEAASRYPYAGEYRLWPGPNSNTFAAWVGRAVPELRLDLPATALGKDFLAAPFVARAPSGTGWQLNLFGAAGLLVAAEEGVELNLLGLTVGVDPLDLAIKFPGIGRIAPFGRGLRAAAPPPAETAEEGAAPQG